MFQHAPSLPGTRLSVAICTWNRCNSLRQTLEGFTGLAVPAATDWEILVVNNNCTDQTDQVIQAYEDRLPVRRAFEPRPGLSHARNRAIAQATGDYILWTDDAVTVSPNWLVSYVDAFRRWPDAALFGGPIQPLLEHPTLTAELQYRLHRAFSKPEVWVQHLIASSENWGLLNGYTPKASA